MAVKVNGEEVMMLPDELVLGEITVTTLEAMPYFNGIKLRIPRFYVLDATTCEKVPVTPHVRAVATLISAVLAKRFMATNINLQVSI